MAYLMTCQLPRIFLQQHSCRVVVAVHGLYHSRCGVFNSLSFAQKYIYLTASEQVVFFYANMVPITADQLAFFIVLRQVRVANSSIAM